MPTHIEHGLAYVLDADEVVDRSRLVGPMNVEVLGVRAESIRGPWCAGGGVGGTLSVNVLAMADRKNLDDQAVVFDDAQGAVAADAVVPLA